MALKNIFSLGQNPKVYSEAKAIIFSKLESLDNFLADAVFPDAAGPSIAICKLSIIMIRLYITEQ